VEKEKILAWEAHLQHTLKHVLGYSGTNPTRCGRNSNHAGESQFLSHPTFQQWWDDLDRRNKPIKLDAIQVIESFCQSRGAIVIKIPVGHQHGLDLGRSLGENIMSIDAMNAEEMNVKDFETILMKIDRQRCVTVVDPSSDKKPAVRIDINEPPRKRTKSTESIEQFNPLNHVSDGNAPPPEADVDLTKPSLDTSSVAFTSQDALEISVFPIPDCALIA